MVPEASPARAAGAQGSAVTPIVRGVQPSDITTLLEMFSELAEYERLTHIMRATEERLHEALFGAHPAAEALLAERGGEAAGYAVFFTTFSSFLALPGIWLEDLFVRPSHRRAGVGSALLAAVAAVTRERGGERLEWAALDWNELALGFYRSLGAHTMDEWITHRLEGEALARLAREGGASTAT
jgi:GNAT superfamily N-acetyltransferase